MQVLVTGANGFVGRKVCATLTEAGHHVRAAVRSPSAATALPAHVEPYLVGSIEDFDGWPAALAGMDSVVHLAARTHVMKEREREPLAKYRSVNVVGTERLLNACQAASVRRLVFVSSIKAVGEGCDSPYRESDTCQPEDAYGISKREAEQLIEATAGKGLEYVILRPPLIYGAGVRGNFLRIIRAVRRGVPLPLGSVRNARSMIYVQNLADAIAACLRHACAANNVFHVADQAPLSTRQLVELLSAAMGKRPRIIPVPTSLLHMAGLITGKSAEVQRLTGSLTLATEHIRDTLGWQPPVTSEVGILRTVAELNGQTCQPPSPKRQMAA